MLFRLLRRVFGPCRHVSADGASLCYRERRPLDGMDVMHFVCQKCGKAGPVVERTNEEHAAALADGAVRVPRARSMFEPPKKIRRLG